MNFASFDLAVYHQPDRDDVRLVYADALEERGEAVRAAAIRDVLSGDPDRVRYGANTTAVLWRQWLPDVSDWSNRTRGTVHVAPASIPNGLGVVIRGGFVEEVAGDCWAVTDALLFGKGRWPVRRVLLRGGPHDLPMAGGRMMMLSPTPLRGFAPQAWVRHSDRWVDLLPIQTFADVRSICEQMLLATVAYPAGFEISWGDWQPSEF